MHLESTPRVQIFLSSATTWEIDVIWLHLKNNSRYSWCARPLPESILSLTLVLPTTQGCKCYYCTQFTDMETEARQDEAYFRGTPSTEWQSWAESQPVWLQSSCSPPRLRPKKPSHWATSALNTFPSHTCSTDFCEITNSVTVPEACDVRIRYQIFNDKKPIIFIKSSLF